MCSLVQQFSSSYSSETDPQADTTSNQPLLASSACAECNYVRSQLGLYHSRPFRPPAVVSKDGLEPGGVRRGNLWTLPGHCLNTAWTLPGHCLDTAWTLPGHCLDTAWTLPGH